jgi:hypothetical protein
LPDAIVVEESSLESGGPHEEVLDVT